MITIIIISICLVINFYFTRRNNLVYIFKTKLDNTGWSILDKYLKEAPISADDEVYKAYIAEYNRIHDIWMSIIDISYNKMLFSFKPLRLKYWLNEEQFKFLNYYDSDNIRTIS